MILLLEATLFFLLALTRRGKLRLFPTVIMILIVVFFSLLSPYGKILLRIGGDKGFAITFGALESGLRRGIRLAGMVFLSQLIISSKISLPGELGKFAILIFGDMFGFVGMIIGVPTFAVIYFLISKYVFKKLHEKEMDEEIEDYRMRYPDKRKERDEKTVQKNLGKAERLNKWGTFIKKIRKDNHR